MILLVGSLVCSSDNCIGFVESKGPGGSYNYYSVVFFGKIDPDGDGDKIKKLFCEPDELRATCDYLEVVELKRRFDKKFRKQHAR